MKATLILSSGQCNTIQLPEQDDTELFVREMCKHIAGPNEDHALFERVRIAWKDSPLLPARPKDMIVNENRIALGLEFNYLASLLYWASMKPFRNSQMEVPPIFGSAIILPEPLL